jgi:glucose/arabinose dehydrogenase
MSVRSRRLLSFPVTLAIVSVIASTASPGGWVNPALTDRGPGDGRLATVQTTSPNLAPTTDAGDPTKLTLGLTLVKSGFVDPVLVTSARDGSNRLFVVEQAGVIRIISGGATLATPFLDLRGAITSGGERGLLGLTFHPKSATNHFVYVNFTDRYGNTAINRYTVSGDPNVIDRTTAYRIMTIAQPYPNHNGGNLAFGPDGYLYIGMGDGGGAGDPGNRAQNLNTRLGKMLRVDVDHPAPGMHYRAPASNPYVGRTGLDEIWSRGLRNPWRWSFDRATGNLWIGDVGQDRYEEIDRSLKQPTAPAGRGENYGWPILEGRACYRPATGCSSTGTRPPLVAYGHSASTATNCSVTGGFVYRGSAYPVLYGVYLFGDFCSGRIWGVSAGAYTPATATLLRSPTASPRLSISSFGEDEVGGMYVVDRGGGAIYRITAAPKP